MSYRQQMVSITVFSWTTQTYMNTFLSRQRLKKMRPQNSKELEAVSSLTSVILTPGISVVIVVVMVN